MRDYFVGLDMGTGSTGWAVTNEEYEILRAHGKALWGVRLFESANTAEERRVFRTARRRLARRNWRIEILQEIFAEEIHKADDGFYLRMKESRYVPEDKRDSLGKCPSLPYALFVDSDYTDKDYHGQFPTIYHLRKYLMETRETPDIRLVYLALHHMMKHRGHFLFSGNIESIKKFESTFGQFLDRLEEEELEFHLIAEARENFGGIEAILKDSALTRSAKKTRLVKLLGAGTSCEKAVLSLIVGGTAKLSDIFGDDELNQCERPKICFADSAYEDYADSVAGELGERFLVIEQAKTIYDWAVLADILGEYDSLSEAKVAVYEKHKKDLDCLKTFVRENLGPDVYRRVFVISDEKLDNYGAYIGMTKNNGKKCDLAGKKCDRDAFYAFLRKEVLNNAPDGETAEYIKQELDKGTFLPKQVTKENGVLPYQVHLFELKQIINNLKDRILLLRENEEKILKTFTFRIPYYVGPLNGVRRGGDTTNWVKRRTDDKIYPWNFSEVVNEEESAERFIRRMTNKCTYLIHEDVLPRYSMLYSKYTVLNELNNLRLNGEPIDVRLKQNIYNDVFMRYRKVTQKKLRDYLVREGIADKNVDITGIDGDFKGTLTAYHDFKEKLTGVDLSQEEKENIILNITLFGDDKKLLLRRLKAMYPKLSDGQQKALCGLSYNGWGRLSEAFLERVTAPAPQTGEVWNIMRALWETNDNLMQVLSEKYRFAEAIEEENGADELQEISYQTLEQLGLSPAVRRQIWQTLKIVREICKVQGGPPKRIFVEMARE